MTLIIFLLVIILSVALAILLVTHRHKRISSEIIRRLDDHHVQSQKNNEFVKSQTEQVSAKAQEIKDFLEGLRHDDANDTDVSTFLKTDKFIL